MKAASPLLAKGFLSRSVDELARRTRIALKFEAVKGIQQPRSLYEFHDPESIRKCVLMSDDLIGGSSKSHFDFVKPQELDSNAVDKASSTPLRPSSYARFHGNISTTLPHDKPKIKRSGYAAFRTPDQPPTIFGHSVWDIDSFSFLALRIKSDGRAYFVNVQTETVEPTDLHQHRLFAKRPGQWETVYVKWNDFVRTSYGFVVEPQTELLRQKVKTVGIGLTDRVEGPFELCIERVWATNTIEDGTVVETDTAMTPLTGNLKNRKGENVQWDN
jgi:NADH dehydrogenase [ubiquinone] 1 alpha subcomplex assembly factor 1